MKEKTNDLIKSINLDDVERYGYATETDKIICPHCGEQWDMTFEDYERSPYEAYEEQCLECEEYFLLDCEPETTFYFTSYKIKEEVAE